MPLVSVTRLRIRSWRYMVPFSLYSLRAAGQARRADGFLDGYLGTSAGRAFWTVTVWRDESAMKSYRDNGAHKAAMSKMLDWADEGAMVHYEQPGADAPSAPVARDALASRGRTSKVRRPTTDHAAGHTVPDGESPSVGRLLKRR